MDLFDEVKVIIIFEGIYGFIGWWQNNILYERVNHQPIAQQLYDDFQIVLQMKTLFIWWGESNLISDKRSFIAWWAWNKIYGYTIATIDTEDNGFIGWWYSNKLMDTSNSFIGWWNDNDITTSTWGFMGWWSGNDILNETKLSSIIGWYNNIISQSPFSSIVSDGLII